MKPTYSCDWDAELQELLEEERLRAFFREHIPVPSPERIAEVICAEMAREATHELRLREYLDQEWEL